MQRKGKKEKEEEKEATCPPTTQEIKKRKTKKQCPRKKRKKKKKRTKHGHFCPLRSLVFSLQFSLHFGEKTFWWVRRENTCTLQFIFLPPHPTKHT